MVSYVDGSDVLEHTFVPIFPHAVDSRQSSGCGHSTSSILGPGLVTYWLWWVHIISAAMSLISPFNKFSLDKTHGLMKCFYFRSPQVPDYLEYIKQPMDLSTIQDKVSSLQYDNLEDFHNDIHLMISNCMIYNSKDTPFYKAALRMTDQVSCCSKSYEHEILTTALHFPFLFLQVDSSET